MNDELNIATAIRLAEYFFAAIDTRQWDAAAEMVDAELAVRFRETELASVIAWARHRDAIVASRQSGEGRVGWSAPGHVDETLLAQYGATPLQKLAGVGTIAELAALSPRAFVAACLETRNQDMFLPGGGRIELTRPVVGAAAEGDAIMHVLYRVEGPGIFHADPLSVDVIRLRRSGDEWKVDPTSLTFTLASTHGLLALDELAGDEFLIDGA